jgi:adenylosuccinate lyase
MRSHIIDSEVYGAAFASSEVAAIFTDERRVQRWLDVEAALAQAQAELGLIPAPAATEITRQARVERIDLRALGAGISQTGHSLVPALRALAAACEGTAGEYVHYGATTQDVIDTGMVLQAKEAWAVLLRDLRAIRAALAGHARRHARTVMAGRTHGQQALPTTFGFKVAVWVDEIDRQLARCAEAAPRLFVGNITGAVGTMAGFGPRGREVQARTLARLGLGVPRIAWHSARDRVVELGYLLVQIAGTLGKIANEVYNLQRSELDELREPFHVGKVGSSTMPHKQNPSTAELVVALSRLVRGLLVPLTDTLWHEHERDAGAWRLEWAALPEALIYTGAILAHMVRVVGGLQVREAQMAKNLERLGGLLLSERVMLALGERIGKQTAHEVVYEVAVDAERRGVAFKQALLADARVAPHLDGAAIDALLDPRAYVGLAAELVADVVGPEPT